MAVIGAQCEVACCPCCFLRCDRQGQGIGRNCESVKIDLPREQRAGLIFDYTKVQCTKILHSQIKIVAHNKIDIARANAAGALGAISLADHDCIIGASWNFCFPIVRQQGHAFQALDFQFSLVGQLACL